MSEKTREVPQLADTTYAYTLWSLKVLMESWNNMAHGPCVHVLSMTRELAWVVLGYLFGFLRHYLLRILAGP